MTPWYSRLSALALLSLSPLSAAEWEGDWAFELPTGEAGWLELERAEDGTPTAGLMWAVGKTKPVASFTVTEEGVTFEQSIKPPMSERGVRGALQTFTAAIEGDRMTVEMTPGLEGYATRFEGRRMPPLPAAPDLSQVEFGEPIELIAENDLSGWRPTDPQKKNGWSVKDRVLSNVTPKTDFSAYGEFANLRTDAEFTDFHLELEYRLPEEGGNSGVYLQGRFEAQVTHRDSSMQGISGPGALFARIEPSENAALGAGKWNRYEITLVDRHVTIVLNGIKVIDNHLVRGPTGGAVDSDVSQPGPLMLQGDHTSVDYRAIRIRPRVK